MCRQSFLRVTIVILGASALLTPAPAEAQGFFFRPRGGIGIVSGFGGLGGWGGYLGNPYSPVWPGYNPAGFGAYGGYGYPNYPGYGLGAYASPYLGAYGNPYNFGANWYPNVSQSITTAGWAVGPTAGTAASPRMRSTTPAYPYAAAVAGGTLIGSVSNQPSEPAVIEVTLPDPGAQVWVQEARTKQTGTERRYVSPALTPGSDYVYSIRARWRDPQGQVQVQQQNVLVQAGSEVHVAFPTTR
jgi:uncharacterized protein (TIGR03000 family)